MYVGTQEKLTCWTARSKGLYTSLTKRGYFRSSVWKYGRFYWSFLISMLIDSLLPSWKLLWRGIYGNWIGTFQVLKVSLGENTLGGWVNDSCIFRSFCLSLDKVSFCGCYLFRCFQFKVIFMLLWWAVGPFTSLPLPLPLLLPSSSPSPSHLFNYSSTHPYIIFLKSLINSQVEQPEGTGTEKSSGLLISFSIFLTGFFHAGGLMTDHYWPQSHILPSRQLQQGECLLLIALAGKSQRGYQFTWSVTCAHPWLNDDQVEGIYWPNLREICPLIGMKPHKMGSLQVSISRRGGIPGTNLYDSSAYLLCFLISPPF